MSATVERFLQRIAALDLEEFRDVVRVWRDRLRRNDAWYAAEDAVGVAVGLTQRNDEMWRLQDAIYDLFRGAPWYGRRLPPEVVSPPEAAAQYLATTAAMALMVADALPREHLATVYEPFQDTIPIADVAMGAAPAA
jgi:hypothetical protein